MSSNIDSYFPHLVHSNTNTVGNAYYSTAMVRQSDFWVLQHQNPVGWAFFSKRNVDSLLQAAKQLEPAAQFSHITDHMVKVYEVHAPNGMPVDKGVTIAALNKQTLDSFKVACERNRKGVGEYIAYLNRPFVPAMHPVSDRVDRTIRLDAPNPII